MDYSMPEHTGPEVTVMILDYLNKYAPNIKKPYICCVSANSNPDFKEKALQSGMDNFKKKFTSHEEVEGLLVEAKLRFERR